MSTTARDSQAAHPAPAVLPAYSLCEFALTTVLLFTVVTAVRWITAPGSPFLIADVQAALAVAGVIVGLVLLLLIRRPVGTAFGRAHKPGGQRRPVADGCLPRAQRRAVRHRPAGRVAGRGGTRPPGLGPCRGRRSRRVRRRPAGPRLEHLHRLPRRGGPALLSGTYGYLGVYLLAPIIGAALGAGIHLLLRRHAGVRRVPTYRLCPTADPDSF